jgi:N-formylglutamate deformylase
MPSLPYSIPLSCMPPFTLIANGRKWCLPEEVQHDSLQPLPPTSIIGHIPHTETKIPKECLSRLLCSSAELESEIERLTDWYTDDLYRRIGEGLGVAVVFGANRFAVDVERFEDDSKEIMAQRGMGVLYTHGTQRQQLFAAPSPAERQQLIDTLYRPHHNALTALTGSAISHFGRALFLDCHSFPADPLPYEVFGEDARPDICLGTEPEHTPPGLIDCVQSYVTSKGLSFDLNKPFRGSLVPNGFYGDARVTAAMIEINRALYLVGNSSVRSENYNAVRLIVDGLLEHIAGWWKAY